MEDEEFAAVVPGLLRQLENESLEAMSVEELERRISRLEAEIARAAAAIDDKRRSRDVAESFFGR